MVEGVAALLSGPDGDVEGSDDVGLADALVEGARTEVPAILALVGRGLGEDVVGLGGRRLGPLAGSLVGGALLLHSLRFSPR